MNPLKILPALLIFTALVFTGCEGVMGNRPQVEIDRITMGLGGCYGDCPVYAVEYNRDLSVRFEGVKNTDSIGFFVAEIPPSTWEKLEGTFHSIDFQNLDSAYDQSVDDLAVEWIISWEGHQKKTYAQFMSLPEEVAEALSVVFNQTDELSLKRSQEAFVFETEIHKPLPILVPPFPKDSL